MDIDNRQPDGTQRDVAGLMHALLVRSAMEQGSRRPLDARGLDGTVFMCKSGNAAHALITFGKKSLSKQPRLCETPDPRPFGGEGVLRPALTSAGARRVRGSTPQPKPKVKTQKSKLRPNV